MTVEFTGEVHPLADLFPILSDEDMEALAESIRSTGLQQPLVLDQEGRLLDGRNRLAACKLAKVEPLFTVYEGDDPDTYALTVNLARRHMSKGQQAMIAATASFKMKGPAQALAEASGVPASGISKGRTVLEHAPDLVEQVVAGALPLHEAYKAARERTEATRKASKVIADLEAAAPDLAELVRDERMTVAEGWAAWKEREREEAERRKVARSLLDQITELAAPVERDDEFVSTWAQRLGDVTAHDLDRLTGAITTLTSLHEELTA